MTEEVYKKLKQLRKERGLTLNNLAEKIGSDYQQISRIERGKSRLTLDVLMKMSDALKTPIVDLVKTTEEHKVPSLPNPPSPVAAPQTDITQTQQILGAILEKIEILLYESQSHLRPQTKALLTSQVYSQALQEYQSSNNMISTLALIDFSIGLLRTMITELNK